jgi:sensor c-di-GMP phosphodiesterase-like protein
VQKARSACSFGHTHCVTAADGTGRRRDRRFNHHFDDDKTMLFGSSWRLPTVVTAVVAAALAAVLPVALLLTLSYRQTLTRAHTQLTDVVEVAAGIADDVIARAQFNMQRFARITNLELSDMAKRLLDDMVYVDPFFREAGVIDAEGWLVHSTASGFTSPFLVTAESRADPADPEAQLLGLFRTRAMAQDSIILAMPVPGRGEVNLLVEPEILTVAFQRLDLGRDGFVAFVGPNGRALAVAGPGARLDRPVSAAVAPGCMRVRVAAARGQLAIVGELDRSWVLRDWHANLRLGAAVAAVSACVAGASAYRLARRRRGIDHDLRRGIDRGELVVEYQPILDLNSGRCVGAEALVRWQHPIHGLLPPGVFIPMALDRGLIAPLTAWLLRRVAQDEAALTGAVGDLRISINCPSCLFDEEGFVGLVERAQLSDDLCARLVVEITEDGFVGERSQTVAAGMQRLRGHGVRFALDDFGTGYSGLAAVRDLRFEYLKIDRTFVQAIDSGGPGALLMDTLLDLAAKLGAEPVAEGIETAAQRDWVRARAVALGQGWLFARALPLDGFVAFARANNADGLGPRAIVRGFDSP